MSTLSPQCRLRWTEGSGKTGERELADGEFTMGRSSTCDIVLDDPRVSRQHARLRVAGNSLFIEDLGSRNGTMIDGERLASADLRGGDVISLGGLSLELVAAQEGATEIALDGGGNDGCDAGNRRP